MRILLTAALVTVPTALLLSLLGGPPTLVFLASAVAIIPLAGFMGRATEELAARVGSTLGGLLNASLGNAAELIIAIFALRAGLVDLVKASLTGSIIGNLLLILGLSFLVGGLKHPVQRFNREAAGMNAALLALAVIGLAVPALFDFTHRQREAAVVERLSEVVALALLVIYLLSLLFSLGTHRQLFRVEREREPAEWSARRAAVVLVTSTALVAWLSEILVGATEATIAGLGVSEIFLGLVVIPVIGNAAEHGTAVIMAAKDKMDLTFSVAVGSSSQIALFVAPLLVYVSLLLGNPMDLAFTAFEVTAVALATAIVTVISLDGESNWLEGAQLLAVYGILATAFYLF